MASDNPLDELQVALSDMEDSELTQTSPRVEGIALDELAGSEGGDESRRLAKFWLDQVKAVDDVQTRWMRRAKNIIKRYRDERKSSDEEVGSRKFNSLWCNIQILQPNLYAREPVPIVERRFRDKDPTGRSAATILERALRNNLEISGFNVCMDQVVNDYLLPGRGVAWVRYEPEFGPGLSLPVENSVDMEDTEGDIENPSSEEGLEASTKLDETGDRIVRESAPVDYISWIDFYPFPAKARIWKEVTAVGKRCIMTRDQLVDRFGKDIGKSVPMAQQEKRRNPSEDTSQFFDADSRKADVFEIWDRASGAVYWVAEGYQYLLDRKDDPLELENFFPVPMPLTANPTQSTLVPVPDFIQYQDQAVQIDEITQRIAMLTKSCKVVGVYNGQAKDIQRMMQEGFENDLIPVDSWAAFAEKGGVAGQISLLPLKEIIGVINEITGVRQTIMGDMDRLTGITDIMRGTTDARETMGGQRLKNNSSSTRLIRRQAEIARICRDIIKIQADIICKHFSAQTMVDMSSAMYDEALGGDKTPVPVDQSIADSLPSLGELAPEVVQPNLPLSSGMASPPQPPAGVPPGYGAPPPGSLPLGANPSAMQNVAPSVNYAMNNPIPPSVAPSALAGGRMGLPAGGGGAPPMPSLDGMAVGVGQNPQSRPPLTPGTAVALAPHLNPPVNPQPPQPIIIPRGLIRIAAAIDLLRNERLRGFRIDIETDSTIYGDMQQDKNDRMEFLKALSTFIPQGMALVEKDLDAAPMLAKMVQFAARGFKVGRDLESTIEDWSEAQEKKAQDRARNPQAQPPSPEQLKLQESQAKLQLAQTSAQNDLQQTHIETQGELQRQQMESEAQARSDDMEMQRQQMEAKIKEVEAANERMRIQIDQMELANESRELDLKAYELKNPKPVVQPVSRPVGTSNVSPIKNKKTLF